MMSEGSMLCGGRWQRSDDVDFDRQEGVVVLAEADLRAGEFLLSDEAVTVSEMP